MYVMYLQVIVICTLFSLNKCIVAVVVVVRLVGPIALLSDPCHYLSYSAFFTSFSTVANPWERQA